MADIPPHWELVRDLSEGGQGHTYVVRRANSDNREYVLKRLKNPKREDYFEREIRACESLDHRNVLKIVEHGRTPKDKPFLVTEFCDGGSLEQRALRFDHPGDGLRFFQQVVAGVADAHAHNPPIYHLDLKPANIFLKSDIPVVGDFGICFIEDDQVTLTKEGPRGSMYYCAPEFRNPRIDSGAKPAAADVYSLGKVLYWLFTESVYDGHEEEYLNEANRLTRRFPTNPQFAFVDELISETVRRDPTKRLASAIDLGTRLQTVVDRINAGGRVLDLRVQQRCIYCGIGHYRPGHDSIHTGDPPTSEPKFPNLERRTNPPQYTPYSIDIYRYLKSVAGTLGLAPYGIPLFLICDYCGNVQFFKLDLAAGGRGENWRP
jgi:serine/threonine-protein kinase